MGNSHEGEVSFDADGQRRTLVYDINAICELESALNLSVTEVAESLSDPARTRFTTVRTLFWAGLLRGEPDITEEQAGDVINVLGPTKAVELLGKAFALTFPTHKEVKKGT